MTQEDYNKAIEQIEQLSSNYHLLSDEEKQTLYALERSVNEFEERSMFTN